MKVIGCMLEMVEIKRHAAGRRGSLWFLVQHTLHARQREVGKGCVFDSMNVHMAVYVQCKLV